MIRNMIFSLIGVMIAVTLLYTSRFIPYTTLIFPMSMSLIPLDNVEGRQVGTRLYFGDFHFHHSYIGTILVLLSIPFLFIFPPITFFMLGFGGILIIDQIPELLSGQWGMSVIQSIG